MKKVLNTIAMVFVVVLICLYFIANQTDWLDRNFGIHLNKTKVVVAKQFIEQGTALSPDLFKEVYINTQFVVKGNRSNFVFHNIKDIPSGYVAKTDIYPNEQITIAKIEKQQDYTNPKQLMYAINVDYLSSVGASLYCGDKAYLWHTYEVREGNTSIKKTEKVFPYPIEILYLKDNNGNIINTNRNITPQIPTIAILRVDENDIIRLEECASYSNNKFFFVKSTRKED